MARPPNEKALKAFELYKQGIKLIDIANQLGVPAGTVRRWKSTYHWDNQSERSETKANARIESEQSKEVKKEVVEKAVESVIENPDLNDKQRLFCLYYSRSFNATSAYQKAYECSYEVALANGPRLLGNARVRSEILKIKKERMSRELLTESDIFEKYMQIAFADITDFVEFGSVGITKIDKNGDEYEDVINQVSIKDSGEVDGTLITEVSEGREGIKVKLPDRMKALDWLTNHMDMATAEQRARIEHLQAQTEKVKGRDQTNVEDKVAKLFEAIGGALDAESE